MQVFAKYLKARLPVTIPDWRKVERSGKKMKIMGYECDFMKFYN